MSDEQTDNQPVLPKSSVDNPTLPLSGADAPPSPDQLVTKLGQDTSPTTSSPGDSPPLPQFKVDLVNDGIVDQVSRRQLRLPVAIAAFIILTVFTLSLLGIVATLGGAFYQALKPENIATFAALEQKERNAAVESQPAEKSSAPSKSEKGANEPNNASASRSDAAKSGDEHPPAKENAANKVDTKIYGEIRDAMVPLVALVSILAVAIVVILGTMLKAAFAPHPNNSSDLQDKDETSPVPLLEALKGLIESIKAVWK